MGTRFEALPGSNVDDIPIPEDLCPITKFTAETWICLIIIQFLKQHNKLVSRGLGDGNCLFRSLSVQTSIATQINIEWWTSSCFLLC